MGYIVRLGLQESREINGIFCLIQSSLKSPEYLHNVINEFLNKPEFEEIEENVEIFNEYVNDI